MAVHSSGFTEQGTYILESDTVLSFEAVFMTGLSGCSSLMYLHPSLNGLATLPIIDLTDLQNLLEHQFTSAGLQTVSKLCKDSIPGTLCTLKFTYVIITRTQNLYLIGYVYVFKML